MTNALNLSLTDRAYDGFVAAANANGLTPEALATEFLAAQGKSYADNYNIGRTTSAGFVRRFTPEEYAGILAAAEQNADVAALVETLVNSPTVVFDDPRLAPGLQVLVDAELLAPERVTALLAYDRPVAQEAP